MKKIISHHNFHRLLVVLCLCLVYITSSQLGLLDRTYWNIHEYLMYDGDFERIRGEHHAKVNLDDLRERLTDSDTLLFLSNNPDVHVTLRYFAYPTKVLPIDVVPEHTTARFLISDLDTPLTQLPTGFDHKFRLRPDIVLYSKVDKTHDVQPIHHHQGWYYVLIAILLISSTWLTGRWLIFLLAEDAAFDKTFKVVMAFPFGFVMVNLVTMFYAMYIDHRPSQVAYILIISTLAAPSVIYWRRLTEGFDAIRWPKGLGVSSSTLLTLAMLSVLIIVFQLTITPLSTGDAIAHWMLKAKIIFHEGYDFSFGNRMEYPIFWSNYAGVSYHLAGSAFDQMVKWVQVVVVFTYAGVLMSIAKLLRLSILSTGILLLGSFAMGEAFFFAALYAETVHTLFILLIVYQGIYFIHTGKWSLALLTCGFMGLVMTKIEGLPQGLILMIGLLVLHWIRYGLFNRLGLLPVAAYLLAGITYVLWVDFSGDFFDTSAVETLKSLREPMTLFKIYKWAKVSIFNMNRNVTSISMMMGMAFILLLINKQRDQLYYYLLITGIALLSFAPIAILSWKLEDILTSSQAAIPRIFSHAFPLVVILVSLLTDRTMRSIRNHSEDHF